jgi:uncharacterized membrane protein
MPTDMEQNTQQFGIHRRAFPPCRHAAIHRVGGTSLSVKERMNDERHSRTENTPQPFFASIPMRRRKEQEIYVNEIAHAGRPHARASVGYQGPN